MATLVSIGSGNFTDSATWGVGDTTTLSITRSTITTVPTTGTNSASATPGAITVKGVCVALNTKASSSGTFTVQLWNTTANAAVAGASVTVNMTDLPNTNVSSGTTTYFGIWWTYFEFASPVTLSAATAYAVRVNTSVASSLAIWRTATANDWLRILVTTTTGAPAATDYIVVSGKLTGAGASQEHTVTMNNTASATTFGGINVGTKGKLNYGVSGSTNYYLKFAGDLIIGASGAMSIGSTGSPMPSTSTGVLEVTTTVSGQYIICSEGIFQAYGNPLTYTQANLAADASAGATTSTTNVSTGWSNGDSIVVPSTTQTYTQFEVETLTANASGTTLTHTSYSNAHGGNSTTMVQARIGNLTRNVRILGTNLSTPSYMIIRGRFTKFDFSYAEIRNIGANATTSAAISISIATNGAISLDFRMNGCSVWRTANTGSAYALSATALFGGANVFSINNTIFHNFATNAILISNALASDTFASFPELNNSLIYGSAAAGASIAISLNMTGNVFASNNGNGLSYTPSISSLSNRFNESTFSNNSYHSNSATGLVLTLPTNNTLTTPFTISGIWAWRNSTGFNLAGPSASGIVGYYNSSSIIDNFRAFGNSNFGLVINTLTVPIRITNSYMWGGTTQVQVYGLVQQPTNANFGVYRIDWSGGGMGYDYLGNLSGFSTAAIARTLSSRLDFITFSGTLFGGTEYTTTTVGSGMLDFAGAGYVSLNHNGVSGSHKSFMPTSTIATDLSIYNTAPASLRVTPLTSAYKSATTMHRVPVKSGTSCTVSVKVRQSDTPDGTRYNGNAPRLIYRYNFIANNLDDVIGATASAGLYSTWETLSYTTPTIPYNSVLEFYIDCDGTAGWINVDNWTTDVKNDTRSYDYWALSTGPYVEVDYSSGESSHTFVS